MDCLIAAHNLIKRWPILFRYLLAGGSGALVNLALLYLLTDIFGRWYLLSAVGATSLSIIVGFVLQKFVTFRNFQTIVWRRQIIFYTLIALVNILINTALLYLMVELFGWHYLVAQIVASGFIAILSFIFYRHIVFVVIPSVAE